MNTITFEGELLEGYHLETVPQFDTGKQFDRRALSAIAGMRAVWLLYRMGRWEHLEDLGVERDQVEPVLKTLHYGARLTPSQVQQLYRRVPQLVEASRELRLAYALKILDKKERKKKKKVDQTIYHAEVSSAQEADEKVAAHKAEIIAAGGTIEAGYARGRTGGIVMVKLPASRKVDPANLLPTSGLRFSRVIAQVIQRPREEEEL